MLQLIFHKKLIIILCILFLNKSVFALPDCKVKIEEQSGRTDWTAPSTGLSNTVEASTREICKRNCFISLYNRLMLFDLKSGNAYCKFNDGSLTYHKWIKFDAKNDIPDLE